MCSISSKRAAIGCWLGWWFKSFVGFSKSCAPNCESAQARLRGKHSLSFSLWSQWFMYSLAFGSAISWKHSPCQVYLCLTWIWLECKLNLKTKQNKLLNISERTSSHRAKWRLCVGISKRLLSCKRSIGGVESYRRLWSKRCCYWWVCNEQKRCAKHSIQNGAPQTHRHVLNAFHFAHFRWARHLLSHTKRQRRLPNFSMRRLMGLCRRRWSRHSSLYGTWKE